MSQITFGILSVKIRYTFTRNGITYYQRSVPGDLISRYGSKTIKERLAATTLGLVLEDGIERYAFKLSCGILEKSADPKVSPHA